MQQLIKLRQNNWISPQNSRALNAPANLSGEDGSVHTGTSIEGASKGNIKKNLPTIPHRSAMTFISACNCGRKQVNKEDPFTLVEANFQFYAELEDDCCADLDHIQVRNSKSLKLSRVLGRPRDTNMTDPLLPTKNCQKFSQRIF